MVKQITPYVLVAISIGLIGMILWEVKVQAKRYKRLRKLQADWEARDSNYVWPPNDCDR